MNTTVAKATFYLSIDFFLFLFILSHLSGGGGRDATLAGLRLCKETRRICNPNER